MHHQPPSELIANITDYKQHMNPTNKCLSHLVAWVKNCWKKINTQAIIRGNTVYSFYNDKFTILM